MNFLAANVLTVCIALSVSIGHAASAASASAPMGLLTVDGLVQQPELNGKNVRRSGKPVQLSADKRSFRIPVSYATVERRDAEARRISSEGIIPSNGSTTAFLVKLDNLTPFDEGIFGECRDLLVAQVAALSSAEITRQSQLKPKSLSHLFELSTSLEKAQKEKQTSGDFKDFTDFKHYVLEATQDGGTPTRKYFAMSNIFDGIGGFESVFLLSDADKLNKVRNERHHRAHWQLVSDLLLEMNVQQRKDRTDFIRSLSLAAVEGVEKLRPGAGVDLFNVADRMADMTDGEKKSLFALAHTQNKNISDNALNNPIYR